MLIVIHFMPFWTSNLIVTVLKLYGLYGTMHCAWHFPCVNSFNATKSLYCIIIFYIDVPTEAQKRLSKLSKFTQLESGRSRFAP